MKTNLLLFFHQKKTVSFLPKILYLLLFLPLFANAQLGPQFYNLNNSGGANIFPLGGSTNKVQWVYGPTIFNDAGPTGTPAYQGLITKVYWRLSAAPSAFVYNDFTIALAQNIGTLNSWASGTYNTPMTQCFYQATYNLSGAGAGNNWVGVTLQTPFLYDPAQSLVFELQASNAGNNSVFQSSTSGLNQRIYGTYGSASGTAGTTLVDFGFDLIPSGPCVSPPTAGTTVVSTNSVCLGSPLNLNLSGNSIGSGQSYQWESSTTLAGTYAPASAVLTTPFFSTTGSATLYYRCAVTCGTSTDYSNPVLVTLNPPFPGGIYTINSALPTSGSNYQSFTDAAAALACGISSSVVFNVAPNSGPYNEQFTITEIFNTSSTNTVLFNGNGNTITFAPTIANRHIIKLDKASYVAFANLNIVGTDPINGYGIQLINGADFNIINNCTIDLTATFGNMGTNNTGIVISGSATSPTLAGSSGSNNSILNTTIKGGYYGITLIGAGAGISNSVSNTIMNCIIEDFAFSGIYVTNVSNSNFTNNNISRPTRSNITTFAGIYFVSASQNNIIQRNRIHTGYGGVTPSNTSFTYGIWTGNLGATVGNENKIINNAIYNFDNSGTIYAIYNVSTANTQYYHNTISLDNAAATAGVTRGFFQTGLAAGVDFRNNVISITRGGSGAKHCIYFNTATSSIVSNNNALFMDAPSGTNSIGYYGSDQTTFANWQAVNSAAYDQNSVSVTPLFPNANAGVLIPGNSSLNDIGAALGVTDDIFLNPRSTTTPDPGAFEFTPAANDAGISTLVSPVFGVTTPGLMPIEVALKNYGLANLTSATINGYITNGTTTVNFGPINYAGTILPNSIDTVVLGSFNFVSGSYDLVAWSTNPNAGVDPNNLNDTLHTSICVGLNGVYTIGATGDYLDFTSAMAALSCGINGPVTFNVLPNSGPYVEQITIPSITGASATNSIIINGNGNTLTFAPTNANRHIILINGADHLTIKNLNIVGTDPTNGYGIILSNQSDYVTLDSLNIDLSATFGYTGSLVAGITVTGSLTSATTTGNNANFLSIKNSNIKGGYYGITLVGSSATANAMNNEIINCKIEDFYLYGLYMVNVSNTTIKNNEIRRPDRSTVSTFYGIYHATSGINNLIESNKIGDAFMAVSGANTSTSYPIWHANVDATLGNENKVINNLIYNINNNGLIYAIYNSSSDHIQYYHNTISLDNPNATAGTTRGFFQTTLATGIDFRNNIVSITRGGTGIKYLMYFATATSSIVSNNNILHLNSPAGTNHVGYYSANQTTFANWQAANSNAYDQNSLAANPLFYDIPNGILYPTNYALDNLGVPLGITTDLAGINRNMLTPDFGVYEFSLPVNDVKILNLRTAFDPCFAAGDTLKVDFQNTLTTPLNFSTQNLNIAYTISGASTASGNILINSGTLAGGATTTVNLATGLNFSPLGTYNFTATVNATWDDLPFNNSTSKEIIVSPIVAYVSQDTACEVTALQLSLTGMKGIVQWQKNTGTGWNNIAGADSVVSTNILGSLNASYRVMYCGNLISNVVNAVPIIVAAPTTVNDSVCFGQPATLSATATGTLNWYTAPTGGNLIHSGTSYTTTVPATTTFYVETSTSGTGGSDTLLTTIQAGNGCGGGSMFNITALSGNINVTGFDVSLTGTVSQTVNVYYRNGGFAGFETTPAAWTLVGAYPITATSVAPGTLTFVNSANFVIPQGATYGIYIEANNHYTTGTAPGTTYADANISVFAGLGLCSSFGGVNNPRLFNGRIHYQSGCTSPTRTPAVVFIKPLPAISLPVTTEACQGDLIILDPGTIAGTYLWSTSDVTQTISPNTAGKYIVTATGTNGC
ncbi:MAG: right-handed parallel beta-helix repeat-containing protein, partial [Bacteroidetes bacterium]|nr:right-handed parallel beta-helix repeat-containing protein [Bacteroidota bacterium]